MVKVCAIIMLSNKKGGSLHVTGKNYAHQLDAKKRMRIPAKLREELGPNYSVTVGSGGCLYVYSEEQTKTLKKKLNEINSYKEEHSVDKSYDLSIRKFFADIISILTKKEEKS